MEINIAGAGAGKTTKMSDKIILLRNQIDAEKKIFCVAFTNSAVDCIRRKLCEHYVQIPENIIVSTIHSFLYREIIKPYYHLLYGKKYEKISIAELPQDAKYKNAKIKMEGEKCLFILTNDLAAHLFNNNTETNKTKNKLYVALTRSLNELSIYILKEVEDKYTKKRIQDFFERYL